MFSGKIYNGYDGAKKITANGAAECSIHHWSDKIVTRGVLLDMAKYKGVANLEKGYIITPADLDGCCKAQNVEVKSGDILCVRTGWMNVLRKRAWPMTANEPYVMGEPGIGLQACKWIKDKQVCAIACDTLAVEAIPFDPEGLKLVNDIGFKGFPVHVELLVHQGVALGEIFDFEALAKDCADDGVYEFMMVAPPLRIVGGVGSPLSPLAIK
jgi:kynurenine formamidase